LINGFIENLLKRLNSTAVCKINFGQNRFSKPAKNLQAAAFAKIKIVGIGVQIRRIEKLD